MNTITDRKIGLSLFKGKKQNYKEICLNKKMRIGINKYLGSTYSNYFLEKSNYLVR